MKEIILKRIIPYLLVICMVAATPDWSCLVAYADETDPTIYVEALQKELKEAVPTTNEMLKDDSGAYFMQVNLDTSVNNIGICINDPTFPAYNLLSIEFLSELFKCEDIKSIQINDVEYELQHKSEPVMETDQFQLMFITAYAVLGKDMTNDEFFDYLKQNMQTITIGEMDGGKVDIVLYAQTESGFKYNVPYTMEFYNKAHDITIHYVDQNGNKLADDVTKTLTIGDTYSFTSPTIDNYKTEQTVISGTMGKAAIEETVVYESVNPTSTVTYYVDGEKWKSWTQDEGTELEVQTPTKEGYTFSGWTIWRNAADETGEIISQPTTVPENDISAYGTFSINSYTLTYMLDGEVYDTKTLEYDAAIDLAVVTPKAGYTFSGWKLDGGSVPSKMPAQDITLYGTCTQDIYTVVFQDSNGDELASYSNLTYGQAVDVPANPTKAADKTYTYAFYQWKDKNTSATIDKDASTYTVTGNAVYVAEYKESCIEYTVVFQYLVGTSTIEYSKKTYHYGDSVEVPKDPTKEADGNYSYEFAGWRKNSNSTVVEDMTAEKVTADVTYTAEFKTTNLKWTINFYNGETLLSTGTYVTGDTIVVPETPVKVEDAGYTYEFAGWMTKDNQLLESTATKSADYYAVFNATPKKFTLRFLDESGTVKSTYTYTYGTVMNLPTAPEKEGTDTYSYEFVRWESETYGNILADVTTLTVTKSGDFKPVYEQTEKKYKVEFKDENGTVFATHSYKYGSSVSEPLAPDKAADETYTYKFAGWKKAGSSDVLSDLSMEVVKADTSYTAVYTSQYIYYKVVFQDWDGKELSSNSYIYNATLVKDFDNPERAEDETYTYQFKGWSPTLENQVTKDVTYVAEYDAIYKKYAVTFKNANGIVISTENYHYGDIQIVVPEDPTQSTDKTYTYTFEGWKQDGKGSLLSSEDIAEIEVTKDTEFVASYAKTYIDYTVTFENQNGEVITEATYHYGDKIVVPDDLESYENDGITYTFIGWSPAVSETATDNVVYKAQFYNKANMYKVIFYNEDGTVQLDEQVTEHGGSVTFGGKEVTKEASNYYTYSFEKWVTEPNGTEKADLITISKDTEVFAGFSKTLRNYIVDFVDEDGTLLSKTSYVYHDGIVEPEAPVKESDNMYDYTFIGWDKEVGQVTGDETFTAQYEKTLREYTVTCIVDEIPYTNTYNYNQYVKFDGTPSRENTKQYTYLFKGWLKEGSDTLVSDISAERVTADAVYTAQFETIVNKYTVSFYDENGVDILGKTQVEYAQPAEYQGSEVTKESDAYYDYAFEKWTVEAGGYREADLSEITEDVAVYASYKQSLREYEITIKSESGDTVEKYHYDDTILWRANPKKDTDEYNTYTFAGWRRSDGVLVTDLSTETVTKNQSYEEVFDATAREYIVTWNIEGEETTEAYTYGQKLKLPTAPVKEGDVQYSYTFAGWLKDESTEVVEDISLETVTDHVTYTAKFEAVVNTYTVTFYDETGTISYGSSVTAYGSAATAPADPTKESSAEFEYTFVGWDQDFSNVTEDMEVKAIFRASLRSYTVTWSVDGTETKETYTYGYLPEFKGSTEKPSTEIYKYNFAGWDKEVQVVTEDVIYKAKYNIELNYVARIGNKYYNTIDSALSEAVKGDVVFVDKDCQMTEDAVVPAGVTLFLPCQDNDESFVPSMETYNPEGTDVNGAETLYRKVEIGEGVTLTVNGTVIVNAITGRPKSGHSVQDISGGYAQIDLDGNIVVDDGGLLDVYGYVKGSGQVTALNGGTIYDLFVVQNWRGGSQALSMYMKYIYPMNESDCHNIEVPIRINYGGSYEGTVRMYANAEAIGGSGSDYYGTRFPQVNVTNGLIRLTNEDGYVVKTYEDGYEKYTIYGGAKFAESTLLLLGQTASTSEFIYPIDGDVIFNLNDGDYSFENDYKFLPGSAVNLAGDATLTVPEKTQVAFYEEFNDVPNTAGTEYPSGRTPASLNMEAGSSLHIGGTLGGIINADNVQITKVDDAVLTITTREANGYLSGILKITNDLQIVRPGCTASWVDNRVVWNCVGEHTYETWINLEKEGYQTSVCTICGESIEREDAVAYLVQEIEKLNSDISESEKEKLAENIRNYLNTLTDGEIAKITNLNVLTTYEAAIASKYAEQAIKDSINAAMTSVVDELKQTTREVSSVGFSWAEEKGASGYQLTLKDANGDIVEKVEISETSYTFEHLNGGVKYQCSVCPFFKINGYKYYGKECSVDATTSAGVVSCLVVTKRAVKSITWKWRASEVKVAGYRVQLTNNKGKVKTKYTTNTKYTFKSLSGGTIYKITVTPYTIIDGEKNYGTSLTVKGITLPKKVTLKKATSPKKNVVKVTWKKITCAGYQVMIAKNKKFTKGVKRYKVNAKASSKKITKLKSNTKYYVRVRAYVVKSNGSICYGKWSKYKTIKCK